MSRQDKRGRKSTALHTREIVCEFGWGSIERLKVKGGWLYTSVRDTGALTTTFVADDERDLER